MKGIVNLLHPVGLVSLVITFLLWRTWKSRREQPLLWRTVCLTWVMLFITCWTPFPERLLASLERPWARKEWASIPQADALLFLGGGASGTRSEVIGLDLSNNSDRITTAIELVRMGKAKALVAGGSVHPSTDANPSEGVATERLIRQWNLTAVPIHQLGVCANTREESLSMRMLVDQQGWKTIILVTSASHMKRSLATFEKQGISVVPVACGFRSRANLDDHALGWINTPDANKIDQITIWLYETLGYAYYWLRDWA